MKFWFHFDLAIMTNMAWNYFLGLMNPCWVENTEIWVIFMHKNMFYLIFPKIDHCVSVALTAKALVTAGVPSLTKRTRPSFGFFRTCFCFALRRDFAISVLYFREKNSLKVSKSQKQIIMSSILPNLDFKNMYFWIRLYFALNCKKCLVKS